MTKAKTTKKSPNAAMAKTTAKPKAALAPASVKKKSAPAARPAKPKIPLTRFQLSAPQATQVYLVGTFNDWEPTTTPMTKKKDGTWFKELSLVPGNYEYLFLVDGQWMFDPAAQNQVPNPYGGCNCLLLVA